MKLATVLEQTQTGLGSVLYSTIPSVFPEVAKELDLLSGILITALVMWIQGSLAEV